MWRIIVVLLACTQLAYAEDNGTTKGAVPIPGEYVEPVLTINHRDTTVTFDELPKLDAKWKKRARVTYKGNVPVALNHSYAHVNLTFVGTNVREDGYPGALASFRLVPTDDGGPWSSSFPRFSDVKSAQHGPILAAFRVMPPKEHWDDPPAPESERRQVVVYVPKGTRVVLVATKRVTDTTWQPLLRVETPKASRIDVIDPGWH